MQLHSCYVCNGYRSILDVIQVAGTYMTMLFDRNYHVLSLCICFQNFGPLYCLLY